MPPLADFSAWQRETLEQFARQAADENRQLRADVRTALDAYRAEVRKRIQQQAQQDTEKDQ